MKNITVITFEALCLLLVLGTASIAASVRRTRSDVWDTKRYRWNDEKQMQDNSKFQDDSRPECDYFGCVSTHVDDISVDKPDEARQVFRVLIEKKKLITFFNLVKEAGLTKLFYSITNVTLFVPTDEALTKPETEDKLEELREDKSKLRDVLLFHVAQMKLRKCDMVNNIDVKSRLAHKLIRINKFSRKWYLEPASFRAECANILNFDNKNCDETVHEIDGLLLPPTGSVYDIIQSDPKFSMLREVLKDTALEETLNNTSPITFLAPANEAFKNLKATELQALRDKCYASAVLGQYVLPEMICSADMGRYKRGYSIRNFKTLHGSTVNVYADEGRVYIRRGLAGLRISPDDTQGGDVTDWEIMATNGIIHSVDKLMMVGDFTL